MSQHLDGFPVVIEIPVAWGEMDAMGHVNNIVYFRYCESARVAYFERTGFLQVMAETGVGPILASTRCDFRKALTYPDTVTVGVRVNWMKADRFEHEYRIVSQKTGQVAAEAFGVVVSYDYRAGRKAPIPDSVRQAMETLEGRPLEPVQVSTETARTL